MDYEPIEVAVALSLYGFNVSQGERAEKLYKHFDGDCAEPEDLLRRMTDMLAFTLPTAEVYVIQALEKYGQAARDHVRVNRMHIDDVLKVDLSNSQTSLHLNHASWETLLGVIKQCVPVSLDDGEQEKYFKITGKKWTVGDFWDSVKELQTQLGQEE